MKTQFTIILATAILLCDSCTTVKVVKAPYASSVKGVRYSLGKPYILVTPSSKGDGSYTVEVIYLPDQNQTYAVQTSTFLAKNVMEVSVDESGILKKIDWSTSSDATVAEGTKALGEIAKAQFERNKTLNEEAVKEAEAKKKAAEDAVTALEEAIEQKKIDRKIAQQDVATLEATYTGAERTPEIKEKIRQARLAVGRIDEEIKVLLARLTTAKGTAASLSASFNDPGAGEEEKAWGPVLFEIEETYNKEKNTTSLALKAVTWDGKKKQEKFNTISKVIAAPTAAKAPTITTTGTITKQFSTGGLANVEITFSGDIEQIDSNQSVIISSTETTNPEFKKVNVSITDKRKATLTFKKADIPEGKYDINLVFSYKAGEKVEEGSASIKLELTN
jgi:hypothetical protein